MGPRRPPPRPRLPWSSRRFETAQGSGAGQPSEAARNAGSARTNRVCPHEAPLDGVAMKAATVDSGRLKAAVGTELGHLHKTRALLITIADFPCCTPVLSRACRHHYPGGTVGCVSRSLPQPQRPSSLLWRVGFRISIFEACSVFTHVTARTHRCPPERGLFLQCFRPFVASWSAPSASGRSESDRVGFTPTEQGHLRQGAHNNAAERSLRTVALGRKSYLFAGSDAGGERAAAMYSLIGSCKLNGIDPQSYRICDTSSVALPITRSIASTNCYPGT